MNNLAVIQSPEGFVPGSIAACSLCLASPRQYIAVSHPTIALSLWLPRSSEVQMATWKTETWAVSLGVYCFTLEISLGTPLAAPGWPFAAAMTQTLAPELKQVRSQWGKQVGARGKMKGLETGKGKGRVGMAEELSSLWVPCNDLFVNYHTLLCPTAIFIWWHFCADSSQCSASDTPGKISTHTPALSSNPLFSCL